MKIEWSPAAWASARRYMYDQDGMRAIGAAVNVDQKRAPHKPLLLLWLFGQFAATGSSAASYQQAEGPVSQLINDFGPLVASPAAARQRAAMPFVHLERDLWDLRDATGQEIGRSDRLSSGRSVRARAPRVGDGVLEAFLLRS